MQSQAATVDQYMAELPDDRRAALAVVRNAIRKNIGKGYVECMGYGMPGWVVPHSIYPAGYHCDSRKPLPYVGFASQKQYMSIYLFCIYNDDDQMGWFRKAWAKTGKKLDIGKSCIRFKRLEDVALEVIAEVIRRTPVKKHIEFYEKAILSMNPKAARGATSRRAEMKPSAKKAAGKVAKKATRKKTKSSSQ